MSRGPSIFRQRDVTRVLKAAVAAGMQVLKVEVDKAGKIIVVTGKRVDAANEESGVNEWDSI